MPSRGRKIYVVVWGYGLSPCGVIGASSSRTKATRIREAWARGARMQYGDTAPWTDILDFTDGEVGTGLY